MIVINNGKRTFIIDNLEIAPMEAVEVNNEQFIKLSAFQNEIKPLQVVKPVVKKQEVKETKKTTTKATKKEEVKAEDNK